MTLKEVNVFLLRRALGMTTPSPAGSREVDPRLESPHHTSIEQPTSSRHELEDDPTTEEVPRHSA